MDYNLNHKISDFLILFKYKFKFFIYLNLKIIQKFI